MLIIHNYAWNFFLFLMCHVISPYSTYSIKLVEKQFMSYQVADVVVVEGNGVCRWWWGGEAWG